MPQVDHLLVVRAQCADGLPQSFGLGTLCSVIFRVGAGDAFPAIKPISRGESAAPRAALIAGGVPGDAQEPRAQGARCIEPGQRAVGADECLLRRVCCVGRVAQNQICKPKDGVLMALHQIGPRVGVAVAGALEQGGFVPRCDERAPWLYRGYTV